MVNARTDLKNTIDAVTPYPRPVRRRRSAILKGDKTKRCEQCESRKNFAGRMIRHQASKTGIQSEFVSDSLLEEAVGFASLGTPGCTLPDAGRMSNNSDNFSENNRAVSGPPHAQSETAEGRNLLPSAAGNGVMREMDVRRWSECCGSIRNNGRRETGFVRMRNSLACASGWSRQRLPANFRTASVVKPR